MRSVIFRTGEKYPAEYENMLKNMTKEHLGQECFVINDKNRKCDYPGWWGKMELFAPWWEHTRPFLYFDLDTFILDDIRDLADWKPDELWMLEDAYQKGKGQSAIMAIPKDTSEIWEKWIKNPLQWTQMPGDQDFLRLFKPKFLQERFSGIYSYKADHCYDKPKGRIVFFHGKPRPHEAEGWAGEVYESTSRSAR